MTTAIKLKKSSVPGKVPEVSDIDFGELAINYADGIIYYKNSSNQIKNFIDSDLIISSIYANSLDSAEVISLIDSDYIQARQSTFGSQGTTGATGAQGTTGSQGIQGTTGTQGTVGSQGVQGTTGTQGTVGAQGVQGVIGPVVEVYNSAGTRLN